MEDKKPNALIYEKSPYLLQHAYNPVYWHPWDAVAFQKAQTENKPIILSIGYATCHWCHVMEKESFEDPEIADIMNRYYISIKVDREERPDIDAIYMSAVTSLTGSGGWPLNVFLTPDLKPFFGGTYFPALSNPHRMSWPDLLLRIARMWENVAEKKKIISAGEDLTSGLQSYLAKPHMAGHSKEAMSLTLLDGAVAHFGSIFDPTLGGFGHAPKFPSPVIQDFLFDYGTAQENKDQKKSVSMAAFTLFAMARGGIYDHIGGGFHRYATDDRWQVPHFEKMIYDNAQLIINYLTGYRLARNPLFKTIATQTADYVLREMTHSAGGFYSAQDADSVAPESTPIDGADPEKIEGAFYVWEKKEIDRLLDLDPRHGEWFARLFNISADGNVTQDPHGYFRNKNILFISPDKGTALSDLNLSAEESDEMMEAAKTILFAAREQRPRPHLDDKVLTSWNGLMISALSATHQVTDDPKYLGAAQNAGEFIWQNLYVPDTQTLYRRWRNGERKVPGMAEDYACLIQGFLDLYASDFDEIWLSRAVALMDAQIQGFFDFQVGGFFMTRADHDANLIIRVKEENDSVLPSANAVSAMNLLRLSRIFDRTDYYALAEKTVACFYEKMVRFPGSMPRMLSALKMLLAKPVHVVITGNLQEQETRNMIHTMRSFYLPDVTLIHVDPLNRQNPGAGLPGFLDDMKPVGKAAAYVCHDFSCQPPVTDPEEFKDLVRGLAK